MDASLVAVDMDVSLAGAVAAGGRFCREVWSATFHRAQAGTWYTHAELLEVQKDQRHQFD
jgi:hypothetical protein